MNNITSTLICINVFLFSIDAFTQEAKKDHITPFSGFQLDISQDFFGLSSKNEDRDFTMGVLLKWHGLKTNNEITTLWSFPQKTIDNLVFSLTKKSNHPHLFHHEFGIGYSAFTPKDLSSTTPVFDDRPYAAVLFGRTNRFYKIDRWVISSSLSIGGVGGFAGDIANYVQTAIHSANRRVHGFTREDPNGWNNQIANRGLPFINYSQRRYYTNWQNKKTSTLFNCAASPFYGGSVGMLYNNINAGINFKIGFYENNFNTYTLEEVNKSIDKDNETLINKIKKKPKGGTYLFANSQASLWLYNSTLQGVPIFNDKDVHRLNYNEIQPIVGLFEFGIGAYFNNTEIKYSHSVRTSQTKLPTNRAHFWGSIKLIVHSF